LLCATAPAPSSTPVRAGGVEHPHRFSLLEASWSRCLDASRTVHRRYAEDRLGGPLAIHADQVRGVALAGLAETWAHLVDAYLADIDAAGTA